LTRPGIKEAHSKAPPLGFGAPTLMDPRPSPAPLRIEPYSHTTAGAHVDYESLPEDLSMWTHMAAGALAGISEHCLVYPIDTMKVSRAPGGGGMGRLVPFSRVLYHSS
jgi:hypothetical protein